MGQFILEAFIIIGMGAAVGFAISFLLIKAISLLPIEDYVGHPVLSVQVALLSMTVLGLIGFMAGFFPARRASQVQIVEAIR
jgi:putative ABC transport system permease protein